MQFFFKCHKNIFCVVGDDIPLFIAAPLITLLGFRTKSQRVSTDITWVKKKAYVVLKMPTYKKHLVRKQNFLPRTFEGMNCRLTNTFI